MKPKQLVNKTIKHIGKGGDWEFALLFSNRGDALRYDGFIECEDMTAPGDVFKAMKNQKQRWDEIELWVKLFRDSRKSEGAIECDYRRLRVWNMIGETDKAVAECIAEAAQDFSNKVRDLWNEQEKSP